MPRSRGEFDSGAATDRSGNELPTGPPLWEELTPNQQKATQAGMQQTSAQLGEKWDALKPNAKPKFVKEGQKVSGSRMSIRAAAGERSRWVEQAEDEARHRNELEQLAGTGKVHYPRGLNWYGEHHQGYEQTALANDLPGHVVSQAGTLMSPNNSPKTEQRSARGAASLATNPDMEVTVSEAHAAVINKVQTEGAEVNGDEREVHDKSHYIDVPVGTHRVGDLSAEQVAIIGSTANMAGDKAALTARHGRNDTRSGKRFDVPDEFRDLASIRNRENAIKGLKIMRGEATSNELNHVLTTPKVKSYGRSTQLATPMEQESNVEDARARLGMDEGPQQRLDFGDWPKSGVQVDPHTAEDSWMHGMSYNAGPPEVAKVIGSNSDLGGLGAVPKQPYGPKDPRQLGPEMTRTAAGHAWNNAATRQAAEDLGYSNQSTQAISWTAMRAAAGQDPDYNREVESWGRALAGHPDPIPSADDVFKNRVGQLRSQRAQETGEKQPRAPRSTPLQMFAAKEGTEKVRPAAKPPKTLPPAKKFGIRTSQGPEGQQVERLF